MNMHRPAAEADGLVRPSGASTPLFSVIVPVYDRAAVLGEALRSILAQTCQDFEIVVVDDGSHDDPANVVDVLGDPRVSFIRQNNAGGGAARNRGIDAAKGRFVAFLDSDDRFEPHHLQMLANLLDGRDDVLAYAPVVAERGHGRAVIKPLRALKPGEHMATYLLCDRGFIPSMTMGLATNLARQIRFSENLRCAEDTDFAIRLFLKGCRFIMAAKPGAIWRDHADPARASGGGRRNLEMIPWIESLRAGIPAKAYYGCYGWPIAKSLAMTRPFRALALYLRALARGCYRPPVAAVVFLQIFLPDSLYRWIADVAIAWLGSIWNAAILRNAEAAPR